METTVESLFPINGIDVSGPYGSQRPMTTPIAVNVRGVDSIALRRRGGSRNGLAKYPNDQIAEFFGVVENVLTPGDNEWSPPLNLSGSVVVEAWGAGGSPLNVEAGVGQGGNGGGGGAYARVDAFAAAPGTKYSSTVGQAMSQSNGDSTFMIANGGTLISASGGKSNGSGGQDGAGDAIFVGGEGGTSGPGLGGGGGGSSGYFFSGGTNGGNGAALNVGGAGPTGFPVTSSTPQGAGGDGATGQAGSESPATAGQQPGGGGGGGCADTGGIDPDLLAGAIGGHGMMRFSYETVAPIQHLAQVVVLDDNYLIASFEDYNATSGFVTDPSTNPPTGNPDDVRNPPPGRDVPPDGSSPQPNRRQPPAVRRRVMVTTPSEIVANGTNATLNISLVSLPGSTGVGPGVVVVTTQPPRSNGDRTTLSTNGAGIVSLTVNEPTREGTVTYFVTHVYLDTATGRRRATRGIARITWSPDFVMTASVDRGYIYETASYDSTGMQFGLTSENCVRTIFDNIYFHDYTGSQYEPSPIPINITLKKTNGRPVANRRIKYTTKFYPPDSPGTPPPYDPLDGPSGTIKTDSHGNATYSFPTFALFGYSVAFEFSTYVRSAYIPTTTLSRTVVLQSIMNMPPPNPGPWFRVPPPTPGVS
jgi:hypothetical protein